MSQVFFFHCCIDACLQLSITARVKHVQEDSPPHLAVIYQKLGSTVEELCAVIGTNNELHQLYFARTAIRTAEKA